MDAAYLKENVGDVLSEGLTQVVLRQPQDQVEFLAHYLRDYVAAKAAKARAEHKTRTLATRDEAHTQAEARKAEVTAAATAAATADATARADHFTAFLRGAHSLEGLLQRFCELLRDATDASAVYIAELRNDPYDAAGGEASGYERDATGDYLKYVAAAPAVPESSNSNSSDASSSSSAGAGPVDMLKERLSFGEGVTHDLFEPEEPVEDEYEEVLDEATGEYVSRLLPKPAPVPRTVFVPNVLQGARAEQVKLFGLPDAGCYLAVRVHYESCLQDAAFDEAEERERELREQQAEEAEQRAADEEERKLAAAEEEEERRRVRAEEDEEMTEEERAERDAREAEAEAVKAAAEAAKPVESDEERAAREAKEAVAKAKADEETVISRLSKRKLAFAVCLDTLGQGRRLSDEQVGYATRLAQLLQDTLLRIDRETYRRERKARAAIAAVLAGVVPKDEDARRDEIDQLVEQTRRERAAAAAASGAVPAAASEGEEGEDGEGGALAVAREDAAFEHRQALVLSLRQQVLEMRGYNVFRGPLPVVQALLYLLGYSQAQIADSDNRPDWLKMRALFDDDLIRRIEDFSPRVHFATAVVEQERALEAAQAAAVQQALAKHAQQQQQQQQQQSGVDGSGAPALNQEAVEAAAVRKFKRDRKAAAREAASLASAAADPATAAAAADPYTATTGSDPAARDAPAALELLLAGVDPEAVAATNYIAAELMGFVEDAVALMRRAAREHRRARADERARARAQREREEEEARAKAEEEAAAAEARAAAGIIDEVDEGE